MIRRTLAEEWVTFSRAVIGPKAPPVQHQAMQDAFYAGAAAMMDLVVRDTDPGTEPTEADMKHMDDLWAEIKEYADKVGAR